MKSRLVGICLAGALSLAPAVAEEVTSPARPSAGIPVDSHGGPTIDPTENVKALTAAGLKSQEELRIALKELLQAKLDSIEKLSELRDKMNHALGDAELRRIDQVDKLRADLNDKLAAKEQDRINAMRLLDVGAAADLQRRTSDSANQLQTQTATLATDLRTQTALLAENLRTLVLNTATQQAAAAKQAADDQKKGTDDISKRLTTVESSLSEGRGKQAVSDPALGALVIEVQKLSQRQTDTAGVGTGRSEMYAWFLGGFLFILMLISTGVAVVVAMRRPGLPAQGPIIYAAPPGWTPPAS